MTTGIWVMSSCLVQWKYQIDNSKAFPLILIMECIVPLMQFSIEISILILIHGKPYTKVCQNYYSV